jgi:predicted nucleic acid-binding protein
VSARIVLDASIVMAWCFEDEASDYADAVLDALGARAEASVPAIWPLEVGNVLVTAERRGRITAADAGRFVDLLGRMPIRVVSDTPDRVLTRDVALAREHGLSVYDASYLQLAMREGAALATGDARLTAAAQRAGVRRWEMR